MLHAGVPHTIPEFSKEIVENKAHAWDFPCFSYSSCRLMGLNVESIETKNSFGIFFLNQKSSVASVPYFDRFGHSSLFACPCSWLCI